MCCHCAVTSCCCGAFAALGYRQMTPPHTPLPSALALAKTAPQYAAAEPFVIQAAAATAACWTLTRGPQRSCRACAGADGLNRGPASLLTPKPPPPSLTDAADPAGVPALHLRVCSSHARHATAPAAPSALSQRVDSAGACELTGVSPRIDRRLATATLMRYFKDYGLGLEEG